METAIEKEKPTLAYYDSSHTGLVIYPLNNFQKALHENHTLDGIISDLESCLKLHNLFICLDGSMAQNNYSIIYDLIDLFKAYKEDLQGNSAPMAFHNFAKALQEFEFGLPLSVVTDIYRVVETIILKNDYRGGDPSDAIKICRTLLELKSLFMILHEETVQKWKAAGKAYQYEVAL